MQYVSFLGHGTQGPFQNYRRDHYKKDTVSSIGSSHKYEGKITSLLTTGPKDPTKELIIDKAIKVTTVADKIRLDARKMWTSLKNGCTGTFTATLILGICKGVAAVVIGITLPALWPVAVAVGAFALALLGFAGWNISRSLDAKEQLAQWKDPIPGYQKDRMMVEQKGFYHAYASDYKGKIVSAEELESLWFVSMDQWADKYDSHIPGLEKAKLQDIRRFMEESPLQTKAMEEAFEDTSVSKKGLNFLKTLSSKYSALKSQYNSIRSETEKLKKQIKNERTKAHLCNDEELRFNLAPYEALIRSQKLALLAQQNHYNQIVVTYETGIRRIQPAVTYSATYSHVHTHPVRHGTQIIAGRVVPGSGHMSPHAHRGHVMPGARHWSHPIHTASIHVVPHATTVLTSTPVVHVIPHHVEQAKAELFILNAKLAHLDAVFYAMTAPIRNLHAYNKSKIDQWANGELSRIQAGEDKTLTKFYKPIKALLMAYKNRDIEEKAEEEIETETKIAGGINTKAPELRKDYEVPKYDKSWSEFVGEIDWVNGIVKKTVINHKGNTTSTETSY